MRSDKIGDFNRSSLNRELISPFHLPGTLSLYLLALIKKKPNEEIYKIKLLVFFFIKNEKLQVCVYFQSFVSFMYTF